MILWLNGVKQWQSSLLVNGWEKQFGVKRTANMTTQKVGVQTIVTRGPANTGFWFVPGDGSSPKWVQHLGTGTNVTTTHTYTGAGTKYQKWIGDLSQITYVDVHNQDYSFNLSSISGLTSLTKFYCYGCQLIEGNLSSISGLTLLTHFYCNNCPLIEGNLSSISGLTLLINFQCSDCQLIEGNLSSISGLTLLTQFYCDNCPLIEGNLSSIAGLTLLAYFRCNNCPLIEGNLSSISGLTSLLYFYCYGCVLLTYTTTTLPQWNNAVLRFDSCGLSTSEVDALIFDLYSAPIKTGGSVNLAGTNDPRTTGAPNDTIYIPALAAAGCPVTSNP